jgi:DNA-binding NarL/FixJ family response regulator
MTISYGHANGWNTEHRRPFASAKSALRPIPAPTAQPIAVLIEPRQILRDCLANAVRSACGHDVIALGSVEEWLRISDQTRAAVILLSGLGRGKQDLDQQVRRLAQAESRVPTVILAEAEDLGEVVPGLMNEVEGFVASDMSLSIAAEAMRLVRAGGVFVPAECMKPGRGPADGQKSHNPLQQIFTARQIDIIEAVRQGKANKTIAFELSLQESTVKVHIRNIMKKLRARNRTEVAFIVSNIEAESAFKT